jgi:chlorinating enzyme
MTYIVTESATGVLGDDEVAAYRRNGYLVPKWRLQGPDLSRLQGLMAKLAADNPALLNEPIIGPHLPGSGVQRLKAEPGWMDIATHPRILDMVEQIDGPDLALWGTSVFYKRAVAGPATAWHQDARSWPMIKPLTTTTVWIAVTDSHKDNGCIRVIPGSHDARRIKPHKDADRANSIVANSLPTEEFDTAAAVDIELDAGEIVIFDVFTIHGGGPNPGSAPRAGYALRFMPTTSHYDHGGAKNRNAPGFAHDTRPLLLVRGVDRSGKNDFQRGHASSYPGVGRN